MSIETKHPRMHETRIANNGQKMTIVRYGNANDIDVEFEDNTIVTKKSYYHFKNGEIGNPNCPSKKFKINDKDLEKNSIDYKLENNEKTENNSDKLEEEVQVEEKNSLNIENIEIVKANFEKVEELDYSELFSGYDELYAITYSSSLDFISKIVNKFKNIEIIFGNNSVINNKTTTLIASQIHDINLIKKDKNFTYLKERINKNELILYLTTSKLSHEKIYILKGEGKYRVIVGSANMSNCAFNGKQRENIVYMDEKEAFNYYKGIFESLKLICTKEISEDSLNKKETVEEDTPIFAIIKEKEKVYIPVESDISDYEFIMDVNKIEEDVSKYFNESKKTSDSKNIILNYDNFQKSLIKRDVIEREENEKLKEYPKFKINRNTKEIKLNKVNFRKYIEKEFKDNFAKNDFLNIHNFIKGFDDFDGDSEKAKQAFYKLLVYAFASPFFSELRNIGKTYGDAIHDFPMYAIIYGESNASKTTMVKLIEKAMFGRIFEFNSADAFTFKNIINLKNVIEGVPIVIDDLDGDRYRNHAGKIIRLDSFGFDEYTKNANSPACIITSNDVKSIGHEIKKRAILLNISATLDEIKGMENAKKINNIIKEISPLFYIMYLEEFIPKLNKMINKMETEKDFHPDVFKISSESIYTVVKNLFGKVPNYVKILSKEDYFGISTSYNAIEQLRTVWIHDKSRFKENKSNNTLEIILDEPYIARNIKKELSNSLCPKVVGTKLILNLKQSEKYLDFLNTKKIKKSNFKSNFFKNKLKKNEKAKLFSK